GILPSRIKSTPPAYCPRRSIPVAWSVPHNRYQRAGFSSIPAGAFMIRSMRFLVILFVLSQIVYAQDSYPFQNPAMPLEDRVSNILSLMTLEEKLACLETSSAVPRLGIPDAGGT